MLTNERQNICVVGDEDQSIYRWRGADVSILLSFSQDFPAAKVIRLERNYRSTQKILDAAGAVVANNPDRLGETLRAGNEGGGEFWFFVGRGGSSRGGVCGWGAGADSGRRFGPDLRGGVPDEFSVAVV